MLLLLSSSFNLLAREVTPLMDNWYFYPSSARTADGARRVSLPYTWSANDNSSGVYSSRGNYVRKFNLPEKWSDSRIFVKFYGVNSVANLFVNGEHAGEHYGASTAFCIEITPLLQHDSENELQLIVDAAQLSSLPPTSLDHNVDCGIYREVELIATPKAAISPLYLGSQGVFVTTDSFTPSLASGEVKVHISTLVDDDMSAELAIYNAKGKEVFRQRRDSITSSTEQISIPFNIDNPQGWSPSSPALYRFCVELSTPLSSDVVEVESGLRVITTDENGRISINSQRVDVRGVVLYHDHPTVGSAMSREEITSDMELVKEVGATAVRSATSPHAQALYDYCDQNGVMAWIDFPLCRTTFLSDIGYLPTPSYHSNAESISREIIAQNYNHPSVVMWGLFSQLYDRGDSMTSFLKSLYEQTKSFDSTRPVVATSNRSGDMNSIPDMISWRQNLGWHRGSVTDISLWRDLIHDKWGHIKSAVSYGESGSINHQNLGRESGFSSSSTTRPQKSVATQLFDNSQPDWSPEANMTLLHEEYAKVLLNDSHFWGVWLCNMFDYRSHRSESGENSSGLIAFDRVSKKDIFYLYRAAWNNSIPTLHIAGRREYKRGEEVADLKIYSSSRTPISVRVNGGKKLKVTDQGAGIFLVEPFTLQKGENSIEATQDSLKDSITLLYEPIL